MALVKLLLVEDDIASLELMTEVFSALEAEVHPTSDSENAARIVNLEKFDGIFLDLEMPKLNGFELAQRVRQSSWNKLTPIVIVTGRDEQETMKRAFTMGGTFFLQKPVDRHKLSSLFRIVRGSMLESRRRSARVPMQTEITCEAGARTVRGRTWNLSLGGMQLEADELKPGDAMRVSFRLPSSAVAIEALGTVVWVKAERQGIQFTSLSTKNEQEIRRFIVQDEKS
jgi:DNA-binding response OmpR family regulator